MAEGFAKSLLNEKYTIFSAGVEAHGLNPKAVEVMNEKGIDMICCISTNDPFVLDLWRGIRSIKN